MTTTKSTMTKDDWAAPCVAVVGISSLHAEETYCQDISAYVCDGAVEPGRTCDKPLCESHATDVEKNKHFCPDCRLRFAPRGQGSLFTSLGKT